LPLRKAGKQERTGLLHTPALGARSATLADGPPAAIHAGSVTTDTVFFATDPPHTMSEAEAEAAGRWRTFASEHGSLDVTLEDLVSRLGPPPVDDEHVLPGLGPVSCWRLRWHCGCEASVRWQHEMRHGPRGAIVASNDCDLAHVAHHVQGLFAAELSWGTFHGERTRDPWELLRQDEHGTRTVMRRFDSELAARCAERMFELRGHKQAYFAIPSTH
jgi:hypothetical protein